MMHGRKEKAVSPSVGFTINFGVAIIAVGLIALTLQGALDDLRESSTKAELEIVGEKVASKLVKADKLAGSSTDLQGSIVLELPVFDDGYTVKIVEDSGPGDIGTIYVISDTQDVNVSVKYDTDTPTKAAEFGSSSSELTIQIKNGGIEVKDG